jgi:hypothetical protein
VEFGGGAIATFARGIPGIEGEGTQITLISLKKQKLQRAGTPFSKGRCRFFFSGICDLSASSAFPQTLRRLDLRRAAKSRSPASARDDKRLA